MLTSVIATTRQECPAQSYGLIYGLTVPAGCPKACYGESATPAIALQSFSPSGTFSTIFTTASIRGSKPLARMANPRWKIADLSYCAQTYHHDYICFDACLMADVQTYYELKTHAIILWDLRRKL
jgi:hypothetical protein